MGLGMPEVVLILVIALIVFGPRKLPELGKSLGQAMSQFRKASDDFKRTWEQEVELDSARKTDVVKSGSSNDYAANHETYDPYNSYSSEPTPPAESSSTQTPATTNSPKSETVAVAAGATSKPEKKHWI